MSTETLGGHRALITGASSGLGRAIARELATRGADLVLVARRSDRIAALGAELATNHPVDIDTIELDLSSDSGVAHLVDAATGSGKDVSILINNAGIGFYGPFIEHSWGDHLSTIKLNILATTELMYHAVRHMQMHGRRSFIVNVASIASFQPVANFSVYSASKAYLLSLSETVSRELAGTGISVSCVCPGGIDTEFFERSGQLIKDSGKKFLMDPGVVAKQLLDAMLARKVVYVPGVANKVMSAYPRLLPRSMAFNVATGLMQGAVDRKKPD